MAPSSERRRSTRPSLNCYHHSPDRLWEKSPGGLEEGSVGYGRDAGNRHNDKITMQNVGLQFGSDFVEINFVLPALLGLEEQVDAAFRHLVGHCLDPGETSQDCDLLLLNCCFLSGAFRECVLGRPTDVSATPGCKLIGISKIVES